MSGHARESSGSAAARAALRRLSQPAPRLLAAIEAAERLADLGPDLALLSLSPFGALPTELAADLADVRPGASRRRAGPAPVARAVPRLGPRPPDARPAVSEPQAAEPLRPVLSLRRAPPEPELRRPIRIRERAVPPAAADEAQPAPEAPAVAGPAAHAAATGGDLPPPRGAPEQPEPRGLDLLDEFLEQVEEARPEPAPATNEPDRRPARAEPRPAARRPVAPLPAPPVTGAPAPLLPESAAGPIGFALVDELADLALEHVGRATTPLSVPPSRGAPPSILAAPAASERMLALPLDLPAPLEEPAVVFSRTAVDGDGGSDLPAARTSRPPPPDAAAPPERAADLDPGRVADLVNRALVEQARRHGIDLS